MKSGKIILLLLLIFVSLNIQAQNSRLDKAYVDFEMKNYAEAAEQFIRVLKNENDIRKKDTLNKYIGICFDEMNQYQTAIRYFQRYLAAQPQNINIRSKLGNLYLKTGQINKAAQVFTQLHESDTANANYLRMLESCHFAKYESEKPNKPLIVNQELINSEYSEFGLAFYSGEIIFSSHRVLDEFSSIYGRIDQGYSNLYTAVYDSSLKMWKHPYPLEGKINTHLNEGTFAYSDSLNKAFFTRCSKEPDICQICETNNTREKWNYISTVKLGDDKFNYAHPSISANGKMLYFASDMPGGEGGQDIWKAPISEKGEIGKPVNLGNIVNTPGDEMFPYAFGDTILLFASDGHVGMGGLDIFFSVLKNDLFEKPVNVGSPINSTSDDFSIILNPDLNGGYFCSNRENETRSDDIYSFFHNIFLKDLFGAVADARTFQYLSDVKLIYSVNGIDKTIHYTDSLGKFNIPNSAHLICNEEHHLQVEKEGYPSQKIEVPCYAKEEILILLDNGAREGYVLSGKITNKRTKEPVEGATVSIKSLRGTKSELLSMSDGSYQSSGVAPDDYLVIRVSREGYLSDSKILRTPLRSRYDTLNSRNGFDTDFELIPILYEIEFEIENIYYEFDKARLLPESEFSLNKLVNLLNENPQIKIQINSHADERGSERYNLNLSDRRSASVVNYLVKNGINKYRLMSHGFGESQPVIKNAKTEEEHQKNRRTTFEIIGEISVVAEGSGAMYDLPDENEQRDADLFNRIIEADNTGKEMTNQDLLDMKVDTQKKEESVSDNKKQKTFYRVQLIATSKSIDIGSRYPNIKSLVDKYPLNVERKANLYKYQLGDFETREQADQLRKDLKAAGYKDCFIVKVSKLVNID